MTKLKIVGVDKEKYTLLNLDSNVFFEFNIRFYGLKKLPQVDDFLGIHNELLDPKYEEYSTSYQFGPLDEVYGRDIKSPEHIDCILLISDNKKTYLKRFFG